jgi:ClpP class serine protease
MSHSLLRLASQVYNTPQLITAELFTPIVDYISQRNSDNFKLMRDIEDEEDDDEVDNYVEVDMIGDVAFIKVDGPLTYKPVRMMCAPEGTSYCGLIEDVQEAIDAGARNIVFTYSSGGGQALGCFLSADEVRAMADEAGVKLTAYIEEGAHSAAYAWACMADEVIISPDASAGSIGCIVAIMDNSKQLEQEGLKRVVISSLDGKSPFNEDGSFSDKFLKKIKEDVDRLGLQFSNYVSKHTGLSVETILAMDAQSFHAEKALELGLVNKIMTPREFLKYVTNH